MDMDIGTPNSITNVNIVSLKIQEKCPKDHIGVVEDIFGVLLLIAIPVFRIIIV